MKFLDYFFTSYYSHMHNFKYKCIVTFSNSMKIRSVHNVYKNKIVSTTLFPTYL